MDSALTFEQYEVKMFGGFSICKGNVVVSKDQSRTKKVWVLLEYLIANRHSEISQEKLIDLLWGEEECDAPLNALKNLIYRCRKTLSVLDPEQKDNFIIFERNTYAWNNDIPMKVDIEQFDEDYHLAVRTATSEEERMRYFWRLFLFIKESFYRSRPILLGLSAKTLIMQGCTMNVFSALLRCFQRTGITNRLCVFVNMRLSFIRLRSKFTNC